MEAGTMDIDKIREALINAGGQISALEVGEYLAIINPEAYSILVKDLIIAKQSTRISQLVVDGQKDESDEVVEDEVDNG